MKRGWKNKLGTGAKYLQSMYLTKDYTQNIKRTLKT
jgi:hypothetical protein